MKASAPLLRETLDRLELFLRQERSILLAMLTYAVAVGVFSLIIPLTVQELVNTFAFSVSPVMVVTIVGIMAVILVFVGIFRVLQFYATDILERRVFVRVTLALAKLLPRYQEDRFRSDSMSRFFETVFLQRALSSLLVDFINVLVGGVIGMTLLALYHPYFVIFDVVLLGSVILIGLLGKGGLGSTLAMSEAKYAVFHWFQEVADNLLQFKATNSSPFILRNADVLAANYVYARQSRFRVLLRQYIGSLVFQIVLHTGLLGTAGWLLSQGELTLGQLVAAEVIVASLLLNL
ncbi:MAG: ABC transporter ATP-binding protein, partial [Nitrospirota bacterium]|nr:ABC transporter ATP-binding protein [Nitrospirota bacterium]